ncbi:MAG: hypothetical protein QOD05_190 [Microbacteriaceae bacterium]|jgi:hypothetical protein|nr:hypothetical protein [Microbacteriaceae bacterium]
MFVAALFHVATGGDTPSTIGVVLALAFSGIACIALTGKRLSVWRLAVSVALSQFLFHALFGLGAGTGAASGASLEASSGAAHTMMMYVDIATLAGHGATSTPSMPPADPWMWVGHAAAALVTIAALRYGELAFWSLYRTARIGLSRLVLAPVPVPLDTALPAPVASRVAVVRDLGVLIGRMRHRGPPAILSFA